MINKTFVKVKRNLRKSLRRYQMYHTIFQTRRKKQSFNTLTQTHTQEPLIVSNSVAVHSHNSLQTVYHFHSFDVVKFRNKLAEFHRK